MSKKHKKLNAKQIKFCEGIVNGLTATEAYSQAGYKITERNARGAASRMSALASIKAKIAELEAKRQHIDAKATEKAIEKVGLSKERVLTELMRIGFSDVRKLVNWGPARTEQVDEDGNRLVTITSGATLIPSDQLDDDTAACVAEVSNTAQGIKIKLYDKKSALVDLGKHLGLFKEITELTGKDGGPIEVSNTTTDELLTEINRIAVRAAANGTDKQPH